MDRTSKQLLALCLIALAMACVACGKSSHSCTLRIGMVRNDLTQLILFLTRDEQFLEKKGMRRVEWHTFPNEEQLLDQFRQGKIDVAAGEVVSTLTRILSHSLNASIIAPICLHGYGLVVRSGDRYVDFNDLSHKKIGLTQKTGMADFLIRRFLDDYRLSNKDIECIDMSADNAEHDLLSGKIDAAFVPEPLLSRLLHNNQIKSFLLSEKIIPDHPHSVLFVTSGLSQSKRKELILLLNALFETSNWIVNNKSLLENRAHKLFDLDKNVQRTALTRLMFTSKIPLQIEKELTAYILAALNGTQKTPGKTYLRELYLEAQQSFIAEKEDYYSSIKQEKKRSTQR